MESKSTECLESGQSGVIAGHRICKSNEAKWMCLENIYEKFHRTNLYDIGGTYINDVADFWFIFKTEQVGKIFLLHLFICNHQEGSFKVSVSSNSNLEFERKSSKVFLPTYLKTFTFKNVKERSQNYVTTYSFGDLDVDSFKDKSLYIAVSFPIEDDGQYNEDIQKVKASHDMGILLSDPVASDFTIESADGDKFRVHKVLLAAQSEVFKAMLKDETAESKNNYVKLVDVGKEDLQCLLEFMYTGTVKDTGNSNMLNLLMLADRYNLTGLQELSQCTLTQQLSVDNALELLVIADMYNNCKLKRAALQFIKRNTAVLRTSSFNEIHNMDLIRELCQYLALS